MVESNVEMVRNSSETMSGSNGTTVTGEEILEEVLLLWGEDRGDSGYENDTAAIEVVEVLEEPGQEGVTLKNQEEEKSQQQHAKGQEENELGGKVMSMQHPKNVVPDNSDNTLVGALAHDNKDKLSSPHECRICSFEAEPERPLFYPCSCSGTIRWVHQDCLEKWLKVKNLSTERCEVCGTVFHFTPIYKEGTPTRLAPSEFLLGVLVRTKRPVLLALSIGYEIILWAGVLPFCTLAISRIYFCTSMQGVDTVIFSMIHSNLHERLSHIGLGIGLCIVIMTFLSILPSVIANWVISFLHCIFLALVKPISFALHFWRKRWIRLWMTNVDGGGTREQRRRIRSCYRLTHAAVLRERSINYNHDIGYDCLAGILFVGRKPCLPPEDEEDEEIVASSPFPPLNDAIINHINAMNARATIVIPGIGFVNLGIVSRTKKIVSSILKPLVPLTCAIIYIIMFLVFFQLIPFRLGCTVLEILNMPRSTTVPGSYRTNYYGEALSHKQQQQYPLQYNLIKLIIDRFLGILSTFEPLFNSYSLKFFSSEWLRRDMIKTAAAVSAREKNGSLELGTSFCAMGLGYALILLVTSVLLFTFLVLLTVKGCVRSVPREAEGEEEREGGVGLSRDMLYDKLVIFFCRLASSVKVALFLLIDIIVLPLWVGSIMDLFTLKALHASIEERMTFLRIFPMFSLFSHWAIGVIYTIGANTALVEVRKVISAEWLRDWLPRHDQFENPEQIFVFLKDMPFGRQLQWAVLRFARFVPILFLSLYLPLQARRLLPGASRSLELKFSADFIEVHLPMELLLLHVIFPLVFDKINIRTTIQKLVSWFFISLCQVLDLDEILVDADVLQVWREEHRQNEQQQGQQRREQQQQPHHAQEGEVVEDDEHQPLVMEESVANEQQSSRRRPHDCGSPPSPDHLRLRLLVLGVANCVGLTVACSICIHLPLIMGRGLFLLVGVPVVSDLYAIAVGLVLLWGLISGLLYFYHHIITQLGTIVLVKSVKIWLAVGIKWLVLSVVWLILAPLLIGSLFEVVLIAPVFHPLDETPRIVLAQDWALGLVALKMWMQFTLMGAMALGGGRRRERRGGVMGGRQARGHPQHGGNPPSLTWTDRLEKVFNDGVRGTRYP